MRTRLPRLALLAAVAALTAAAPSPALAQSRSCANVRGGDVVGTTNLTCRSAHKIIRAWTNGVGRDGRYDRRVFGGRCRHRVDPYEGDVMRCRKGSSVVGWYVNLPQ